MPELPEVETARRLLVRWLSGRRVVRAEADATRVLRGSSPQDFAALHGRLLSLDRRGKYLLFTFEQDRGLLAHLGMTGKFVLRPQATPVPYSRARLFLDSAQVIHLSDPRMFGRLQPAPASRLQELPAIRELGVDPLVDGLTAAQLQEALGRSRQELKVALMDQGRLAGLGNIHAAEALFRAGLHPSRKADSLQPPEWLRLTEAIHATLAFGLQEQSGDEPVYLEEGTTENPFLVYGRAATPCVRCGTPVQSFPQAGRTTHFCPKCQPLPRPARGPRRPRSDGAGAGRVRGR